MNQTAQGLAALGRGQDSQLVHMTPGEVAGLQALAQKHGGSLTINPETGLPEAGFLSSILPMVIGAGLAYATGGTSLAATGGLFGMGMPATIGLGVGGLQTLATGSLKKGLMAGLGAYGGAGLAGGLAAAATPTTVPTMPAAIPEAALAAPTATAGITAAGPVAPITSVTPDMLARGATEGLRPGADLLMSGPQVAPTALAQAPVAAPVAAPVTTTTPAITNPLDARLAAGQAATPMSQTTGQFLSANKFPLGAMGLSALAGMQPDELNAPAADKGMVRPYTYSREKIPGAFQDVAGAPMSSKERRYFTDQFTALTPYKAPGPEYMAAGGPVEEMSNANAIGASTGYPQSGIRTGAYSNPFQQPMGQNVVTGAQDAAIDPYTGQARFADGGSVNGYTYDPMTQMYAKKGGEGVTMVSPTGGTSGASAGAGGSPNQPLSQQTIDFLDNEAKTPGARDARMQGINDLMSIAAPGGMAARALSGALSSSTAGQIGNFFDPPGSQPNYGIPVDSRGTYAGNPMGQTSYESGEGNPGESSGFTNDAGGSEVSGSLGFAQGGISNLGSYSDGGRLLRGPGDGVSDSIPAMIGQKQQARLADGEFVVPARIVSELGNGSTEAGARQLYAMMDRVQKNRKKSIGKGKVAADSKSSRLLPA